MPGQETGQCRQIVGSDTLGVTELLEDEGEKFMCKSVGLVMNIGHVNEST